MPTRGRSRKSSSRSRRKTTWSQTSFQHSLVPIGGQSATDITHPAIANNNEPTGTCVRLIGNWSFSPVVGVSLADYNMSVGITLLTIDALAAFAVPDPAADVTQDWYFWDSWGGGMQADGSSNITRAFDIRSSRRLREGFRLIWVTDNLVMELAGVLDVRIRTLWMMP